MNLAFRTPVHLRTNLMKEEVVTRLRDATATTFLGRINPWFAGPVLGKVKDDRCVLRLNSGYRNRVPRELRLTFTSAEYGCNLDGEFATPTVWVVMMLAFFAYVALFNLLWFSTAIRDFFREGRFSLFELAPLGMLALMYAIFRYNLSRSLACDEDVLQFLSDSIGAAPTGEGTNSPVRGRREPSPANLVIRPRHESPEPQNPISDNPGQS